jgi:hypothetical protein
MGVRVTPADDLADSDRLRSLGDLQDDEPSEVRAAPGSLLDRLRSRAADRGVRTLDIPVPGRWRGELVVRFKPLGVGELERFVEDRRAGRPSGVSESREVVLWLFEDNSFALGSVVDRLVEWAADPDASEAPGES